jgi:hypothetical protein
LRRRDQPEEEGVVIGIGVVGEGIVGAGQREHVADVDSKGVILGDGIGVGNLQGYGGWGAEGHAIEDAVGEGVAADVAGIRGVGKRAIGVKGEVAALRILVEQGDQVVVIGIGVVGQDAGGPALDRAIAAQGVVVIHGHGRRVGDGEGHQDRVAGLGTIEDTVGEAVAADKAVVRGVVEGAVGVEHQGAMLGVRNQHGGQVVVVVVAVVDQDPWPVHVQRAVMQQRVGIGGGDRRCVGHLQGDRYRIAVLGTVEGTIGEGIAADEAGFGHVIEGAVRVEHQVTMLDVLDQHRGQVLPGVSITVIGEHAVLGHLQHLRVRHGEDISNSNGHLVGHGQVHCGRVARAALLGGRVGEGVAVDEAVGADKAVRRRVLEAAAGIEPQRPVRHILDDLGGHLQVLRHIVIAQHPGAVDLQQAVMDHAEGIIHRRRDIER